MSGVALITGGQQGIGLGIARALVSAGFRVALAAEREPDAPEVTAALSELGPRASYFTHDVRNVDAVPTLLDTVTAQLGPVTTLVSNAGVPARIRGDMLALSPENFDHVMDINLRGGFFLAQQVALRMLQAPPEPYRALIFITSVSAAMASVERAEYCISKAGAAMMTQLFALRLAGEGIGVFEIRPGIIATPMTAGVREAYGQRIAGGLVPAGRWGEPADVGAVAVPMATGQMAFATGAVVPVDGGLSLARL
ncbi:3-ketoacyl-ACP reductase [Aestuariivirga litoralis]|uniref:3-ketoacyl-ACP reductase n=1 Tax=Aestuariivirga litoralis TaxID=2650924 RepID=A0A2W2BGT7_9HYPH|nr:3-ketoacyl-ACP reductase [Aestuariivirga litoralis]PZF75369.1 3-ketoacyl-ACP reductase [Aestuariivirga litoralis]